MDWVSLYTRLDGRIGRQDFWTGHLVLYGIGILALLADVLLGTVHLESGLGYVSIIVSLALIYPWAMVNAKRWHDRGKSGLWTLIVCVPLVGLAWLIVECGLLRGIVGENQYGLDPLEAGR